jgi:hypothetical protein
MRPVVTPVCINITPSRWMFFGVLLLHTMLISACLLYFPYKVLMSSICLLSCIWTLYCTGWFPKNKFLKSLQIDAKGNMSIKTQQSSDWCKVTLENSSVVTRFACILHLKDNNDVHKICLLPDNMTQEHYRKLCIYGRWQKLTDSPTHPIPN